MKSEKLKINKTAFLSTEGINNKPKNIWIVLHGYGQLCSYFIKKFDSLDKNENLIIAPEALSKYYLNGNSGRVGATWMTKHEREIDIKDNHNYLDLVYKKFVPKNFEGKVILLGFSQGAATAARWLSSTKNNIHHLILWASVFPPDLKIIEFKQKKVSTTIVVGNKDEYLTTNDVKKHYEWAKENLSKVELVTFEGNHNIFPDTLKKIATKIKK